MGLPSYAMPGANLYMTEINEQSLNEVKENIRDVIEGKQLEEKKKMIDIHSHIIFGVDDGAKNENDTRDLLEESYNQGALG